MQKGIWFRLRKRISQAVSYCRDQNKERDDARLVALWTKLLEAKIERNVFGSEHKKETRPSPDDPTHNRSETPLEPLRGAARPERSPLHESTLRVCSRQYRDHVGVSALMEKIEGGTMFHAKRSEDD